MKECKSTNIMKTKLTLFLLLLAGSLQLMFSQTWEYVNTLQNEWLRKICTQGLDTVYIVGRNGLIARSIDRSATWTKQYPVTAQLNDIIFCNHATGFAVGNNGTILKTSDSGDTWTQVSSGTTQNLNAIAAASIDNIWTVGDNGMVLYSRDGGSIWQVKNLSLTAKLNDISFRNSTGYIVGNSYTCYKTDDNGDNWIQNNISVNNPNNFPLGRLILFVVNQTMNNHTCILYGWSDGAGEGFNIDGEIKSTCCGWFNGFNMINDTIGYGMISSMTSNAENDVRIYKTNVMKSEMINSYRLIINKMQLDDCQSDICVINDTIGYAITGRHLYKINNYLTDIENHKIYSNDLKIEQYNDHLYVNLAIPKLFSKIEIISLYGNILTSNNAKSSTCLLDISFLNKGTYIIRYTFTDKTKKTVKWTKR